ncbi:MAG: recombinase family protein [Planctomycetes bacterium]|nr:recombinase family protein [Planctomycetota bacterium]
MRSTKPVAAPSIRVGIYTRKSTEEGLGDEFNTLDAQRSAVEAYITSQRENGWIALPERYDDGGYTGANTDRPAFQRLMADVDAGKIDIVGVYKIDRLSRSLLDFTHLMAKFREHDVTFVSITQQFSTSTPVGRMTSNLLATFAEFEREQISERTRDKMQAARKRGMYVGGRPVLGYTVVERKLVPEPDEAKRVRDIFELHAGLGSVMRTVEELNARGWRMKSWTDRHGTTHHGRHFDKKNLTTMLRNPTYIGKVEYGGELYDGKHEAIVPMELWNAVRDRFAKNSTSGAAEFRNKFGALLKGLAECGVCRAAMTHTYSSRRGRHWRFYVCRTLHDRGASACPGSRISAPKLDEFVIERIKDIGKDPALVAAAIEAAKRSADQRRPEVERDLREAEREVKRLTTERGHLIDGVARGAKGLVERLEVTDDELEVVGRRARELAAELLSLETHTIDEADLRRVLAEFMPIWDQLVTGEKARVLHLLIERVVFDARAGEVEIKFRPSGIKILTRKSA